MGCCARTGGCVTVDLSKIKPGDEVAIRAWVVTTILRGDYLDVRFTEADTGFSVETFGADAIVSHTPKALSVGDRVRSRHSDATVLAVHGDDVCIVFDTTGEMGIRPARMLERIP